jgi:translation initiation factor 2B subunit (eIF-2B alpha/beta/delta family)
MTSLADERRGIAIARAMFKASEYLEKDDQANALTELEYALQAFGEDVAFARENLLSLETLIDVIGYVLLDKGAQKADELYRRAFALRRLAAGQPS